MNMALELQNVVKNFTQFQLDHISFQLPQGYIMGLVGRNGAGKTTTIKLILELLKKDSGMIRVFGKELKEDDIAMKQDIAVVLDELFFVEDWKLSEVEAAIAPFYTRWDSDCYHQYLKRFELPTHQKVKNLSKGMKMKLMLAVALSHQAKLLILDEPTSGLDPVARDELLDILMQYIEDEEHSILFSTHITSDLEKIADVLTIMDDGKIFYSGLKEDLKETYGIVKGGLEDLNEELKAHLIGIQKTSVGFTALFPMTDIGCFHEGLVCEEASVDDILIHIAKEERR